MLPGNIIDTAKKHPLAAITASRIVTEICSASIFLGAAHILNHEKGLIPVKRALGHILEPVVPQLDRVVDNAPAMETDAETARRQAATPAEKAYIYANAFIDNGIRTGLSVGSQVVLMRFLDNQLGMNIPSENKKGGNTPYLCAALWDQTVQLGSALMLNTVLSRPNEDIQRSLAGILEKKGVAKEDAACLARDGMGWVLPNITGALAGIASLYHSHGQTRA